MEIKGTNNSVYCFSTVEPGLQRDVWKNIDGAALSNLEVDDRFPDKPDETSILKVFDGPRNNGDNYGSRISGYFRVRTTDLYIKTG